MASKSGSKYDPKGEFQIFSECQNGSQKRSQMRTIKDSNDAQYHLKVSPKGLKRSKMRPRRDPNEAQIAS